MKYLVLLTLLLASIARAETPTERAEQYFKALQEYDFIAVTEHFDPEHLSEFRASMLFYKDADPEAGERFVQQFFGADKTVAEVDKYSDAEFFAQIFSLLMGGAYADNRIELEAPEILGEVKEGDDICHLVTRSRAHVGEISVETMEVLSLKRYQGGWRLMMSGKIRGLSEQLKAGFAR